MFGLGVAISEEIMKLVVDSLMALVFLSLAIRRSSILLISREYFHVKDSGTNEGLSVLPVLAVSQITLIRNNHYVNVAYFGLAYSHSLQNLQTSPYLQTSNYWSDATMSQSYQLHCETWIKFFSLLFYDEKTWDYKGG